MLKNLIKIGAIGTFSGCVYVTIEMLFKGSSHITMFILAFIVGIILTFMNDNYFEYTTPFEFQVLAGTLVSTCFEFIFGMLFNQDFSIWDYRNLPGTIMMGQINLLFVGAWALICCFGIPLLDTLQYKLGLGEKPHYEFILFKRRKKEYEN